MHRLRLGLGYALGTLDVRFGRLVLPARKCPDREVLPSDRRSGYARTKDGSTSNSVT